MIIPIIVGIGKAIGYGLDVAIAIDQAIEKAKPAVRRIRDRLLPPEPSHPLSHRDVEHIQAQIRSATHAPPRK